MTEATLKNDQVTFLRNLGGVVLRHEDRFTVGIPDTSWTLRNRTHWLESKFEKRTKDTFNFFEAMKKFKGGAVQVETLRRLAHHGSAYFVIYLHWRNQTCCLFIDGQHAAALYKSKESIALVESTDPLKHLLGKGWCFVRSKGFEILQEIGELACKER